MTTFPLVTWLQSRNWSIILLWAVYLALLGVLLPHTAWAFGQFEPAGASSLTLGWIAAIAFEGAIAAFTFRLKGRIEKTPRYTAGPVGWRKFKYRYLHVYSLGLLVAIAVSSLANWAHSVEFGGDFIIFSKYSIPPLLYTVAFGAILPACSLLFARILADVQESEAEPNQELTAAKRDITELRRQLTATERRLLEAEGAARLLLDLTAEDKARRILAAAHQWPDLPRTVIAQVAGASPSYVTQVLATNLESEEQL